VTDGSFIESKEVIGGFAILRANSKEAIQLAKDFLQVAGDGECELRQVYEADQTPEARSLRPGNRGRNSASPRNVGFLL